MRLNKKKSIYILTGVLTLVVLILVIKWVIDMPYRRNIPSLPDMGNISAPLREQLKEFTDQAKQNPTADNLGRLGMVYHSSTYYEKAAQCYQFAIKRNKSKWIWYYYNGYLKKEMGQPEEVIENFRAVVKLNAKIHMAWYYIGEGYKNLNLNAKAEVSFKNVITLSESNSSRKLTLRNDYFPLKTYALFQLAQNYLNDKQFELAEQTLKQVIQNYITFGPAYRLLGNVYGIEGDSSMSTYYTTRAGDFANYSPPVDTLIDKLALMSRSELYLLKQIDEAEQAMYPEYALQLAQNGIKYIPDNKYLVSKTIKLLLRTDSGQKAVPLINKHIGFYKEDFGELKETGGLFYEKGFTPQSVNYYQHALEIKPDDSEVQSNLILSILNEGNKTLALSYLESFIKKYPKDPDIIANAIYILLMIKEHDQALAYLSVLKQLSPTGPRMYLMSGIMAEQEGNLQKAINMYELSFKGNPRDLVSIQSLAEILMKHELWAKYISHLKKALMFNPNEPYILEKLGTILVICPDLKFRDYNQGKIYSERAFVHKACPTETMVSAGISLAEAYEAIGDKDKALIYMTMVSTLAHNQNAPREYLDFISKKLAQYQR
jgi:tetratricopeptide (TPR) repeat protein